MTEDVSSKKSTFRKIVKWIAGALAVLVVLLVGVFFFLQSQFFISRVLPKAQNYLKENYNIDSSFEEVDISLFRQVVIENAIVSFQNEEGLDAKFSVRELNLQFSLLKLLQGNFEVSDVSLVSPSLALVLPATTKTDPLPEEDSTNPVRKLRDFIQKPPVNVDLQEFVVTDAKLAVQQVTESGERTNVAIKGLDLAASLKLKPSHLDLSFSTQFGENADLSFDSQQLSLSGVPIFKTDIVVELDANDNWKLVLQSLNIAFGTKTLNSKMKTGSLETSLKSLSFFTELGLEKELVHHLDSIISLADVSKQELQNSLPKVLENEILKINETLRISAVVENGSLQAQQSLVPGPGKRKIELDLKATFAPSVTLNSGRFSVVSTATNTHMQILNLNVEQPDFGFTAQSVTAKQAFQLVVPLTLSSEKPSGAELDPLKILQGLNFHNQLNLKGATAQLHRDNANSLVVSIQAAETHTKVNREENLTFENSGTVSFSGEEDVQWKMSALDEPKKLDASFEFVASPRRNWLKGMDVSSVESAGRLKVRVAVKGAVFHPETSVSRLKETDLKRARANFEYETSLQQTSLPNQALEVSWNRPILLNGNLRANHDSATILTQLEVPQFSAKKQLAMTALHVNAQTTLGLKDFAPTRARSEISASIARVNLLEEKPFRNAVERYLAGVSAKATLVTDLKENISLSNVVVSNRNNSINMRLSGQSNLKGTTVSFRGENTLQLPSTYPLKEGTAKMSGGVFVPWQITRHNGNQFSVSGRIQLSSVSLQFPKQSIDNARGSIAFHQEIEMLEDNTFSWTHEIDDNPFHRVDALRIRPFLDAEAPNLRIEKITVSNKSVGPLRAKISVQQNLMQIEDIDLSLFDGVYTGQCFVDLRPENFRVGFLGRLTNLDVNQIPPPPEVVAPPDAGSGTNLLSARIATVFELERTLLEGRVDVTKIGQRQVLGLINILDPQSRDAQLNKARLGLQVAYPTYVGLQMNQGLLDFKLDIGGAVTTSVTARQLPLTALIAPYAADVRTFLKELPLE